MTESAPTRPTTVTFGPDVILGRRRSRAFSAQQDVRETEFFRRQSLKYQLPRHGIEDDSDYDTDSYHVSEEEIRRNVFGKPITEINLSNGSDNTIARFTVSSARRSVVWSRERRLYEDTNRKRTEEFKDQPYNKHKFPSINKHYPGTWKTASYEKIQETTDRLYHSPAPTAASTHMHKFQCFLHNALEEEERKRKHNRFGTSRPSTSVLSSVKPCIKARPRTTVSLYRSNFKIY